MYSELFRFIEQQCMAQGIDESHGMKHSQNCVDWVNKLVLDESAITEDELQMAIYSAALHDMCDKKYTNIEIASKRIHEWLLFQNWSLEMADTLISIITNMSYSLLKQRTVNGIPHYPNYGKWQRAYHLARHADLLDAYLVGRCYLYTKHIYPTIMDTECWKIVEDLFHVRVFRYVEDGWITMPLAIQYANDLEQEAIQCFITKTFIY